MSNHASPRFWACYRQLSPEVQTLADKNFSLFEQNPQHPSLHFKKAGRYWSVRVGLDYRALAVEADEGLLWIWIGAHDEYERLIGR